jgi:hypothetical protein
MGPRRYDSKVDENQGDIVTSLAKVGSGCPDLAVGFGNSNFLIEIKMPGEHLNPDQVKWHESWRGRVFVVETLREAIEIVTIGHKKIRVQGP